MSDALQSAVWPVFGAWIKRLREDARISQADAAKRAGIDRQQWYRIENGISGTRRETVLAMARVLGIPEREALAKAGFAGLRPHEVNGFRIDLPEEIDCVLVYSPEINSQEIADEFREAILVAYRTVKERLARERAKGD